MPQSADEIALPKYVIPVLQCALVMCARFEASVTSWYRTPTHNKNVGGVANSPHLYAEAVDVVYDAHVPALSDLNSFAADYGCEVIREHGPATADGHKPFTHDHLQRKEPHHA